MAKKSDTPIKFKVTGDDIAALLLKGKSVTYISEKLHVSRPTIHKRLDERGDRDELMQKAAEIRAQKRAQKRLAEAKKLIPEVLRLYKEKGLTLEEIRAKSARFNRAVTLAQEEHTFVPPRTGGRPFTDVDRALGILRQIAGGVYISIEEYEAARKDIPEAVGFYAILGWFGGSWERACIAAGLKGVPAPSPRKTKKRRSDAFTGDEIVAALYQCYRDLGELPTSYTYRRWSTGRDDVPSTRPVIIFFGGSWPKPVAWLDPSDLEEASI